MNVRQLKKSDSIIVKLWKKYIHYARLIERYASEFLWLLFSFCHIRIVEIFYEIKNMSSGIV